MAAVCNSSAAVVGFAREGYVVLAGEPFVLELVIRSSPGDPGDGGLFSYGVRLIPDTTDSLSVIDVGVPPPLDFFGVTPGALVESSPSLIGVKGNINIFADPMVPYGGELLATIKLSFAAIGEYRIDLDFLRTVGPNEQIFLSGDGTVLDDAITFGAVTVRVLDEAQILPLVAVGRSGAGGEDVDVSFPTIRGLTYTIQACDDLVNWTDLETIVGDGDEFLFHDPARGSERRRFYRVVATTDGS
jgi:hypothetical protein